MRLPLTQRHRPIYWLPCLKISRKNASISAWWIQVVGSARLPVVLKADDRYYIGPHNGLFELIGRRASKAQLQEILWRPDGLSASFHGRDLFAPIAARLAQEMPLDCREMTDPSGPWSDWPDDLAEIIYIDAYGNAMTGLRACEISAEASIEVNGLPLKSVRTFSDAGKGDCFWYRNSQGLVEIACNQGSAADNLVLTIGLPVNGPN